jgi:hypothetical protein
MVEPLPSFDVFMEQKLGAGARLQTAMTWEDTYLEYIGRALYELLHNGATPEGDNGDGEIHPTVGYTELIDPRLENWRYFTKDFTNIVMPANSGYQLYPYTIDEWGSVLVSSVRMSSPDCRMTVKVYSADGQYLDINNTANELLDLGRVTAPTGLGLDLNKYDNTNNLYAFELRAPWPGLPFYKKIEIWLSNETASAITIYNATVTLIKLDK